MHLGRGRCPLAVGGKASITPRTSLVAVAARMLGRPVKLVVPRDQGFTTATYRAETRHHVKLGAERDGRMTSYHHEGWEVTSRADDYGVAGTESSAAMYATPDVKTKFHLVKTDRNTPGFMRSPPEVPYMFALESAIDELAVALNMDPVELRRRNDTDKNPTNGVGTNAAIANAVYHATGKRIRSLPVRIENLIG